MKTTKAFNRATLNVIGDCFTTMDDRNTNSPLDQEPTD
uniref:Uncharacterized protein n=1 Tax=Medicago truncatula TaxID=3880 RepID=I3S6R0_MEDTR|nr:unknown [Medicago truncatula]